ncbi:hypothetical protein SH139x_003074 [Planctomycetaceae bacterium SH139]
MAKINNQKTDPIEVAGGRVENIIYISCHNPKTEATFWDSIKKRLLDHGYAFHVLGENGDAPYPELPYGILSTIPPTNDRWQIDEGALRKRDSEWNFSPNEVVDRSQWFHALASVYASAFASLKPRAVIIWSGERTSDKIAKSLLKDCGCDVLASDHSPFPGMIYADPSGAFANASFAQVGAQPFKDEDERRHWREIFSGYQERTIAGNETWWHQPVVDDNLLRERLPHGKKCVLFAGQVDGDIQRFMFAPQYGSNLDAFKHFCSVVRSHRDEWFILGKHHPYSTIDPNEYRRACEGIGIWVDDIPLSHCWDAVERVAAVNSSVLSEAAMRGVPALSMGKTLVSGGNIFYELDNESAETCVQEWLSDARSEIWRENWIEWGAWMFSKHLFAIQDGNTEKGCMGAQELADRLAELARDSSADYLSLTEAGFVAPVLFSRCATLQKQLQAYERSVSLKLGKALTWPLRACQKYFKARTSPSTRK